MKKKYYLLSGTVENGKLKIKDQREIDQDLYLQFIKEAETHEEDRVYKAVKKLGEMLN